MQDYIGLYTWQEFHSRDICSKRLVHKLIRVVSMVDELVITADDVDVATITNGILINIISLPILSMAA